MFKNYFQLIDDDGLNEECREHCARSERFHILLPHSIVAFGLVFAVSVHHRFNCIPLQQHSEMRTKNLRFRIPFSVQTGLRTQFARRILSVYSRQYG